jgi:uncharacterized protein
MNVLLLADTHLRHGQADRLITRLGDHLDDADVIIHAGDITDASVLSALRKFAPVHAVLGNNDHGMTLPERLSLRLDNGTVADVSHLVLA